MVTQHGARLYFEESKSHTISEKHVVIGNTESVDQLFPMPLIHHIQKIASTALESIPKLHKEQVDSINAEGWSKKESIIELAGMVRKSVKPVNNTSLPPNYRRSVVRVLTKRALKNIGCE